MIEWVMWKRFDENFALGRPPRLAFSRYSHVKIEAKEFVL